MIIWGWRDLTSDVSEQDFRCPQCNQQRRGSLKQVRKYFTLYFIPLIPLGSTGAYVQCGSCAGTFGEEVLTQDPQGDQEDRLQKMLGVMVMAALADGKVDAQERAEINRQYTILAGLPYDSGHLNRQIEMAIESKNDLNGFVSKFAHELSSHGKALVVKLSFLTMSASSNFNKKHQHQLSRLPDTLGITESQYRTLIEEIS